MKAIIFAGGAGTRLWPLSRKNSPKQFEEIIGNKSTIQLTVERLLPDFSYSDIYISTNSLYKDIIKKQLPQIPEKNLILEPEKKDVGPALALAMGIFNRINPQEPVVILWSDHLVKKVSLFKKILKTSSVLIKENPGKIIFIGHKPRYPSVNLGYIHLGQRIPSNNEIKIYKFEGFKYKPDKVTAQQFYSSKEYAWNLGYFVTTPAFIYKAFSRFAPNIFENTEKILSHYEKKDYQDFLNKHYSQVESINFDNAILENLDKKDAMVIVDDIQWSDIGAWESLKEALENHPQENVIRGNISLESVKDSLIYNYENEKLLVAVDLEEHIVVNTKDVLLIAKKTSVPKIKTLVEGFKGTDKEKLT